MERRYKSLILTDEWETICRAREDGLHVVPCLPLKTLKTSESDQIQGEQSAGLCKPNEEEKQNASNMDMTTDLSRFPYVLEDADHVEESYLDMIDARLCGYPLEILRTDRTIVREICEADVDGLYEIYRDPEITRYMENLYEDKNEELSYTRDYIKWHYGLYGFGMWIITDHEGRLLGRAGFEQKEDADYPELGFMIRKQEQGKGLAHEVCSAILTYAHDRFEWKGVRSRCHPENEASIRLLNKLGFQREDEPADEEGYDSYLMEFCPCI